MARLLGQLLQTQMGHLLELLGDPPNIENVPPEFWDEAGLELIKVGGPLEQFFLEQAKDMMARQPIGIDWALVHREAVDWASRYSFELVRGINATSRNALQRAVSAFFERGQTREDLEQSISNIFGPIRAEMIAVTEVTRASVQGELVIADGLRAQGVDMAAIWQTSNDELVCPICAPRNQRKRGDGWSDPPPAHPRCRCWINHELPKVRSWQLPSEVLSAS